MTIANTTQVGGDHYVNPFQHWDLADEADLGYFEGQISKYVTRNRKKKGKEDAEKAQHFCEKLIELAREGRGPRHKQVTFARTSEYALANKLTDIEYACITGICNWRFPEDLVALRLRIIRLIGVQYPERGCISRPGDGSEPTAGYVNQD